MVFRAGETPSPACGPARQSRQPKNRIEGTPTAVRSGVLLINRNTLRNPAGFLRTAESAPILHSSSEPDSNHDTHGGILGEHTARAGRISLTRDDGGYGLRPIGHESHADRIHASKRAGTRCSHGHADGREIHARCLSGWHHHARANGQPRETRPRTGRNHPGEPRLAVRDSACDRCGLRSGRQCRRSIRDGAQRPV